MKSAKIAGSLDRNFADFNKILADFRPNPLVTMPISPSERGKVEERR